MSPRVAQFAAIISTALALVPGGAHLLELASKISLDPQDHLGATDLPRLGVSRHHFDRRRAAESCCYGHGAKSAAGDAGGGHRDDFS
jgi:hypothetical protein